MWKNMAEPDKPQMKIKYGTCTLRAWVLWKQSQSQYIILLFHNNNVYANTPQYVYMHYKFSFHAPPSFAGAKPLWPLPKINPWRPRHWKPLPEAANKSKFPFNRRIETSCWGLHGTGTMVAVPLTIYWGQ